MSALNEFLADSGMVSVLDAAGVYTCPNCHQTMRLIENNYFDGVEEYVCWHSDGNRWAIVDIPKGEMWHIRSPIQEMLPHQISNCERDVLCPF